MGNDIAVIKVEGNNLAQVWEKSLIKLWERGRDIRTEYDKPPLSKESAMIMVINKPLSEPRIHLGFPGILHEEKEYRGRITNGIYNNYNNLIRTEKLSVNHERFFEYETKNKKINQIDNLIEELSKNKDCLKAQAITWLPDSDPFKPDSPNLQRVWYRLIRKETKGKLDYLLRSDVHWRSQDAYKESYINMFNLIELQNYVANKLSKKIGLEIILGPYIDFSDSYYLLGSDFKDFEDGFLRLLKEKEFYSLDYKKTRAVVSNSPIFQVFLKIKDMPNKF